MDGGIKTSKKAEELIKAGNKVDLKKKGMSQSTFSCLDAKCDFIVWHETDVKNTSILVIEKTPHQNDIVEDENIEEAEELAKQAEEEELPF